MPETSRKPARERDPWLDNAKMVLVTLVVVGHAVVLLPHGDVKSRVYDFIYYIHIPAFVLVTGYLSRSFRWSRRHLTGVLTTLLVPYAVFELAMSLFRVHVTHEVSDLGVLSPLWLDPHWPMWYLVVLAMWRLATPVLKAHWLMVPLSVVVSVVAGVVDLETFDLNRALGFLPFFVIGLHLSPRVLQVLSGRGTGVAGLGVLAAVWWLAGRTDEHWSTQWLYFRASYAELEASFAEGVENRSLLFLVGLAGSFAVLTLVPRRRSVITAMGAWTMGVYLFHGFPVRYVESRGFTDWLPGDGWAAVAVTVAAAVALALLLAWPPVASRLVWAVDPVNTLATWRRRRREPQESPVPG